MNRETKINIRQDGSIYLAFYVHAETITAQFTMLLYQHDGQWKLLATDVGFHSDKPTCDQGSMRCDIRPSGHCYYDGSSLQALELQREWFATKDNETVFKRLEEIVESHNS